MDTRDLQTTYSERADVKNCSNKDCMQQNPQPLGNFSKNRNKKDGLQSRCRSCGKQYNVDNKEKITAQKKQYYEAYKEESAARGKQYYEDNKEKIAAQNKQYCVDNKEKIAARSKRYRQDNKEKIAARRKKYYGDHKEKSAATSKKYHEDHREELKGTKKKYREDHKEELKVKSKQYYEDHKEELKGTKKKYREDHKEEIKVKSKQYYEDHKGGLKVKSKQYYEHKRAIEVEELRKICEPSRDGEWIYLFKASNGLAKTGRASIIKTREKQLEKDYATSLTLLAIGSASNARTRDTEKIIHFKLKGINIPLPYAHKKSIGREWYQQDWELIKEVLEEQCLELKWLVDLDTLE